jgi:hypothetical protein
MAKDQLANLSHAERMEMLMREKDSPKGLTMGRRVLELMQLEFLEVLDMQKMAARRQGVDPGPLPTLPTVHAPAAKESMRLAELIESYRTHKDSPYPKLRHATQRFYDRLISRLVAEKSEARLSDLNTEEIQQLYDFWTEGGTKKLAMGHALITMLRGLVNFGTVSLENSECERLSVVLHNMKFTYGRGPARGMTAKQAAALRAEAHKMDMPSIALAQAFQFDCKLSQKDVVGEYVPLSSEPGESAYARRGSKWLRGIRWEEIDEDLVLRHSASLDGKLIVISLRKAPMVMEELERLCGGVVTREKLPREGAVILRTPDFPWETAEFRRQWRRLARAAGIPDDVKNSDSRSSANDDDDGGEPEIERPAGAISHTTGLH